MRDRISSELCDHSEADQQHTLGHLIPVVLRKFHSPMDYPALDELVCLEGLLRIFGVLKLL